MTRSNAGTCVHNIQNFISQTRRGQKYLTDFSKIDTSLALAFYNFLTEGSNKLPSLEYTNKIIERSNENNISEGYGVVINMEDGTLVVELSVPINSKRIRIDKISAEKHKISIGNYDSIGVTEIDSKDSKILEKLPEIDIKRIKFLQKYLSNLQIKEDVKTNKLTK